MKKIIYLIPTLMLMGCAVTEWVAGNQGLIEGSGEAAEGFGPWGYVASGALGLAVTAAKWYEHKNSAKDVIEAVQKAKQELPPESKKKLAEALHRHMPSKVKKYVSKVKKRA